jgi:hypothetical protein
MAKLLLTYLELMLPTGSSNAPYARRMDIPLSFTFVRRMDIPLSFTFSMSNTSDVCVPKLLRNCLAFLMAHVILM